MYLKCPLCGKLAHMNCFTPDEYSEDIECVEMRSLGRGRGFEVTSRFSALGDEELMDMISMRCKVILSVVGVEVTGKVDVDAVRKELVAWRKEALGRREVEVRLKGRIVKLEEAAEEAEDADDTQIAGLQEEVDAYEEESDDLVSQINEALSEVYEEFDDLVEAVTSLITEYNEAMEELEDEEED